MEERQSNISTFIGIGLIFLLLFLWMRTSQPPKQPEQTTTEQNAQQPSQAAPATNTPAQQAPAPVTGDSASQAMTNAKFGAFAAASMGKEQTTILENDLVKVTFSNKGGRIQEVFLKKFEKISVDTAGKEIKNPVRLLEDNKNRFEYELPVNNTASGKVLSSDLYFTPSVNGNTISFRADAGQGRYFEQRYTVRPNDYTIDYQITGNGLQSVLSQQQLRFNWLNHLDKLEKNQTYERTMSSVYFKKTDASSDYCDCRKNVTESLGQVPVQWFAHSNQFFNTAVVANGFNFTDFTGETMMLTDADPDLKLLHSTATIPFESGMASMTIYSGPNEFERLRAFGVQLEDIIPFGASVFGAINRWVIHPIFDILQNIIGIPGIVILILTLLVKLLLYPLTYRMVLSQSKMAALKPQLEGLKKKHGDDQQAMSVETMKLYSTYGVNPLGGCLPVFLQMPIWFALYRFFPAAIEFRQQSFLWATDLSSYDKSVAFGFQLGFFRNQGCLGGRLFVEAGFGFRQRRVQVLIVGGQLRIGFRQHADFLLEFVDFGEEFFFLALQRSHTVAVVFVVADQLFDLGFLISQFFQLFVDFVVELGADAFLLLQLRYGVFVLGVEFGVGCALFGQFERSGFELLASAIFAD